MGVPNHRIREELGEEDEDPVTFKGPIEVDETWIGGKNRNVHWSKRKHVPKGSKGLKTTVLGIRDRHSGRGVAYVVPNRKRETLQPLVERHMRPDTKVYTDGHKGYRRLRNHSWVDHKHKEYVRDDVHTNGIEGALVRVQAQLPRELLLNRSQAQRYLDEFAARQHPRRHSTHKQMGKIVAEMIGKQLLYRELIT